MIGVNQNNNSHPYGGSTTVTARQAWAILSRHARDEIAPLRLQELCHDKDRVSSLVEVYSGDVDSNRILIVDLSRQLLTDTTLNHLLNLATAVELKRFIRQIAWGPNNPEKPVRPVNNAKHSKQPIQMPMFDKTRIAHFRQPKIDATLSHDTVDTLASQQHQQRPHSETIPSMHLALRVPAYKGYEILDQTGVNVLTGIHQEWHRMERYSESVRLGQLKGAGGHMIRDVVVVGQGVAVSALKFIYTALLKDEQAVMASRFGLSQHDYYSQLNNSNNRIRLGNLTGALTATFSTVKVGRRMKFLSTVDPIAAASVVADLDPATTLIVSIALIGTEETGLATTTLKNWLLQGLSRSIMSNTSNSKMVDSVLAKHMILVTGSDRLAATTHKPESVYVIPEHARCEAFTAYTVATLLVGGTFARPIREW